MPAPGFRMVLNPPMSLSSLMSLMSLMSLARPPSYNYKSI